MILICNITSYRFLILTAKTVNYLNSCISALYPPPPPQYNCLTLQPYLVFILFYLGNAQTDLNHRSLFKEEFDKVFANLKLNKHLFLLGKNNFISAGHAGSLHASVPVLALT